MIKRIDWKKVAVVAFLQTMFFIGMAIMLAVYELVEMITPCTQC